MNPKMVKKAPKDAIQAMTDCKWIFSVRPGKDNTKNRKFPFQKMIPFTLPLEAERLTTKLWISLKQKG